MKNYIISGRLAGAKVKYKHGDLFYKANHKYIVVDNTLVQAVKCIATEESKSFVSGLLRGYFGRLLGNNAWLAALQSARNHTLYTLKVTYWDDSASMVLVNYKLYLHFMEKF